MLHVTHFTTLYTHAVCGVCTLFLCTHNAHSGERIAKWAFNRGGVWKRWANLFGAEHAERGVYRIQFERSEIL